MPRAARLSRTSSTSAFLAPVGASVMQNSDGRADPRSGPSVNGPPEPAASLTGVSWFAPPSLRGLANFAALAGVSAGTWLAFQAQYEERTISPGFSSLGDRLPRHGGLQCGLGVGYGWRHLLAQQHLECSFRRHVGFRGIVRKHCESNHDHGSHSDSLEVVRDWDRRRIQ